MSTKEQTLSWLAELPEDSSVWRELHDDARLLRDIAAAEDDVRNGRERPLAEGKELLEHKWAHRRSKSVCSAVDEVPFEKLRPINFVAIR